MYKKMKKTRVGMITIGFVVLVLAVILLCTNTDILNYLLTGADINQISVSDLRDGKVVHGQLNQIFGCYAEKTEAPYGLPVYAGSYYVIPVGEETYMGVYLDKEYGDQVWNLMKETKDYINGDRQELPEGIFTRGRIYQMDTVEESYFQIWLREHGLSTAEEISNHAVSYTYEVIPLSEWNSSKDIAIYMIVGILLIAALIPLLWVATGRDIAGVKKRIKENGWNVEEIEADILSGSEKKNVILGRKYLLSKAGWKWKLDRMQDIIWAYHVAQTGGAAKHMVYLVFRNVKWDKIILRKEEEAQEILKFFAQTQPHIILGYSEELNTLCRVNFTHLVQLSDERASSNLIPFSEEKERNADSLS